MMRPNIGLRPIDQFVLALGDDHLASVTALVEREADADDRQVSDEMLDMIYATAVKERRTIYGMVGYAGIRSVRPCAREKHDGEQRWARQKALRERQKGWLPKPVEEDRRVRPLEVPTTHPEWGT